MTESAPQSGQDPAAEGLTPHEQFNADLMAAAEGMDGMAIPTVEQFQQARALAQELKPTGQGYYANGKRVKQEVAETVELVGDPERWEMDEGQEAEWRAVANAKHVSDIPEDIRAHVGKVDVYEPGSSILGRAQKEANARLALHDQIKAEEAERHEQAEQAAAEARSAKMDAERQRVYDEEHAKVMTGAARDIEAKVEAAVAHVDRNNPDAMRLLESTKAKFRAGFERDASMEAHAKASAAADAREAYINENGGIDELDRINYQDKIGVKRKGEKAPDDDADGAEKPDELQRPENVSWKQWHETLPKDRPALVAEANARAAAEAQADADAEAAAAAADDGEHKGDDEDTSEPDAAESDTDKPDGSEAEAGEADEADDAGEEDDEDDEDYAVEPDSTKWWKEVIDKWKNRRSRGEAGEAASDDDEGDEGDADDEEGVVIEADGTRVRVLDDPSPEGRRRRLGRMMDRARAFFHDPEHGDKRRRRAVVGGVLGGVALAGGAALAYYLTRGAGGVEAMGTALPFAKGTGHQAHEAVKQHIETLRTGSNPWEVAKNYLHSIGVKNPSDAKILKLDELEGQKYFAAHPELGHYSWAAWTRVATDLPAGTKLSV